MLADQSGFRPIYVGFMAFRRAQADNRMNGAGKFKVSLDISTGGFAYVPDRNADSDKMLFVQWQALWQ